MKLTTKILSLPTIVAVGLVLLGAIVLVSLERVGGNIKTVTQTVAPQANSSAALVQNVLERNSSVQQYLRTGDDAEVERFQALQSQSAAIASQLEKAIAGADHLKNLQDIREYDAQYSNVYVQDVVENNRIVITTASTLLNQTGPQIVQSLTDIINAASLGRNSIAAAATNALQAFQSARIYLGQYIVDSNSTDAARVEMELIDVDNMLFDLERSNLDARLSALTATAKSGFSNFSRDFATIVSAIELRNQAVAGPMTTASQAIIAESSILSDVVWKELDNSGREVEQTVATTRSVVVITTVLALILGMVPAVIVTRKIKSAIQQTVTVADQIAHGELDHDIQITSKDETGQLLGSLDTMVGNLKNVVGSIQTAAGTVKSGASEISAGTGDLSNRTAQQSASLEDTASSMEEMTQAVKQNASNAVQASELAKDARARAESCSSAFGDTVAAMEDISESSRKISEIISVIDEIAFQTNLLALNAAVEAARAGESGRGFAVVASEVRNLAGRSATAANEIKDLINDSGRKVLDGTQLVNSSRDSLGDIVKDVKKVSEVVNDIAVANQEQSTGIEMVSRAIESMDSLTQQNKTLVQEAAAASQLLGEQADDLSGLTNFFKSKGSDEKVATDMTFESSRANSDVDSDVDVEQPVSRAA